MSVPRTTSVFALTIAALVTVQRAPTQSADSVWSGWLRAFLDGDAAAARAAYARAARAATTSGGLLALSRLLELSRLRNDEDALRRWVAAVPPGTHESIVERLRNHRPAENLDLATPDPARAQRRARWIELARRDWDYCARWSNTTWPLFRSRAVERSAGDQTPAAELRLKLSLPPRAPIAIRRRAAQLADLRLGGQRHGADRLEFDLVQRIHDLAGRQSWLVVATEDLPTVDDASLARLDRLSQSPSLSKLEGETLRRAHSRCVDLHAAGETETARRLLKSLPYRFR